MDDGGTPACIVRRAPCAVRRARPLLMSCSPLRNTIDEDGPNIFVAANCDACTRHRGGTPVETGTSPANLTSGRTSVRTIIPNTGKRSSKRVALFSKTEQCCPWLASVAGSRPPSVPMKMRHRAAGNLDLRARKDDLAHAHAADTD